MEDPPKMYCRVDVDEATGLRTTAWIALSRDRESMTITIFDGWKLCVNIPLDDWNNRVCTSEDVRRAAMTCIGKQLLGEETISVTVARPLVEEEPIVEEEFVEQIVEQERPSAPEPITPITPNPEPVTSTSPVQCHSFRYPSPPMFDSLHLASHFLHETVIDRVIDEVYRLPPTLIAPHPLPRSAYTPVEKHKLDQFRRYPAHLDPDCTPHLRVDPLHQIVVYTAPSPSGTSMEMNLMFGLVVKVLVPIEGWRRGLLSCEDVRRAAVKAIRNAAVGDRGIVIVRSSMSDYDDSESDEEDQRRSDVSS
ncbi:hypothetical protein FRC02_005744 [Tulasnella sp. 418]|nr:hypothetical protein FRC02_005744 [Tulasnella sp. 418]